MKIEDVMKYFKNDVVLASYSTGISTPSFNNYRRNGRIPYSAQCVIQVKTGGELLAREEDA